MTKESLALQIIKDHGCADFGNVSITPEQLEKHLSDFAKQQAVEFFKWNARSISEYLGYLRRADKAEGLEEMELELNHFENNSIEGRYALFIENQFIEQQNK